MKVLNEHWDIRQKLGPNQYFIAGYGMEVAILARVTLLMWRVKGVKFNTLVVLGFGWPVEICFGLLSVSETYTKYVYRVLACLWD